MPRNESEKVSYGGFNRDFDLCGKVRTRRMRRRTRADIRAMNGNMPKNKGVGSTKKSRKGAK